MRGDKEHFPDFCISSEKAPASSPHRHSPQHPYTAPPDQLLALGCCETLLKKEEEKKKAARGGKVRGRKKRKSLLLTTASLPHIIQGL